MRQEEALCFIKSAKVTLARCGVSDMATDDSIAISLPCARYSYDGMLASQGIISSYIYIQLGRSHSPKMLSIDIL